MKKLSFVTLLLVALAIHLFSSSSSSSSLFVAAQTSTTISTTTAAPVSIPELTNSGILVAVLTIILVILVGLSLIDFTPAMLLFIVINHFAGVIKDKELLYGFSNNGVLAVVFIGIVVEPIGNLPVVKWLTHSTMGGTGGRLGRTWQLFKMLVVTAIVSNLLPNAPHAQLFTPIIFNIAVETGMDPKFALLPMSIVISAANSLLIASASNLVTSGVLKDATGEELGMADLVVSNLVPAFVTILLCLVMSNLMFDVDLPDYVEGKSEEKKEGENEKEGSTSAIIEDNKNKKKEEGEKGEESEKKEGDDEKEKEGNKKGEEKEEDEEDEEAKQHKAKLLAEQKEKKLYASLARVKTERDELIHSTAFCALFQVFNSGVAQKLVIGKSLKEVLEDLPKTLRDKIEVVAVEPAPARSSSSTLLTIETEINNSNNKSQQREQEESSPVIVSVSPIVKQVPKKEGSKSFDEKVKKQEGENEEGEEEMTEKKDNNNNNEPTSELGEGKGKEEEEEKKKKKKQQQEKEEEEDEPAPPKKKNSAIDRSLLASDALFEEDALNHVFVANDRLIVLARVSNLRGFRTLLGLAWVGLSDVRFSSASSNLPSSPEYEQISSPANNDNNESGGDSKEKDSKKKVSKEEAEDDEKDEEALLKKHALYQYKKSREGLDAFLPISAGEINKIRFAVLVIAHTNPAVGRPLEDRFFVEQFRCTVVGCRRVRDRQSLYGRELQLHTLEDGDILLVRLRPNGAPVFAHEANSRLNFYDVAGLSEVNPAAQLVQANYITLPECCACMFPCCGETVHSGAFGPQRVIRLPDWLPNLTLLIFLGVIIAAVFKVNITAAAIVASGLYCILGFTTVKRAVHTTDWGLFVKMGVSFGIGIALQNSGLGDWVGYQIGESGASGYALIFLACLITAAAACVANNKGSLQIGFSLTKKMFESAGLPTKAAAVVAANACIAGFALPMGCSSHFVITQKINYTGKEFILYGTPLLVVYCALTAVFIQLEYG